MSGSTPSWNSLEIQLERIRVAVSEDSHRYPHSIEVSIENAMSTAISVSQKYVDECSSKKSLVPMLHAVAKARIEFEPHCEDEGYGRSTIGSFLRYLLDLQVELGEEPQYSFVELTNLEWVEAGEQLLSGAEPEDDKNEREGRQSMPLLAKVLLGFMLVILCIAVLVVVLINISG